MISLSDIYDKDLNLLLGSGASHGLFPTLKLGIRNDSSEAWSLEELATYFETNGDARYVPLFMHYYESCIRPAQIFAPELVVDEVGAKVLSNYRRLLETLLSILSRRKPMERRCNVFTTNYDGCIPLVSDGLLQLGAHDFVLNDGTRGFRRKMLEARNFSSFLCQTGVFDRHHSSVPQINFIQLHGSVYWRKTADGIEVDYRSTNEPSLLDAPIQERLQPFSEVLMNSERTLLDLERPDLSDQDCLAFLAKYKELPIVNPTKWKFYETLYEEHYYQMLRMLSYELEKPNAVLITFGFSFADEHILNLVKRSLSNPHLQVFVCCFSKASHAKLSSLFRQYRNVRCLGPEGEAFLDFTAFNTEVFTTQPEKRTKALQPLESASLDIQPGSTGAAGGAT